MSLLQKYSALIIDSETDSRMRLKQATISTYNFGEVLHVASINQAKYKLEHSESFDIVFISYRLDHEAVNAFIKEAKNKQYCQDSAFVLILGTNEQDASTLATNMMIGADGFLLEPYSVDSLLSITELAAEVKYERQKERREKAIRLILNDMIKDLNEAASNQLLGQDPGRPWKQFKDACALIQEMDPAGQEAYFKIGQSIFMAAKPPKVTSASFQYSGPSERVKKRLEARARKMREGS